jgi:hypothetical protein
MLAQAVAKGFKEVDERIDRVEENLTDRIDQLENNHVRRIENLELATVDLRRSVTKLNEHTGIQ